MAASLNWIFKAFKTYLLTFDKILYSHPLELNLSVKLFREDRISCKTPRFVVFYIGCFNVFLACLLALSNIFMHMFNFTRIPKYLILRFLILVGFSLLSITLNFLFVGFYHSILINYYNMLLKYNKSIQLDTSTLILYTGKCQDRIGFLTNFIVVLLFFLGIILGPLSILRNSDPAYTTLYLYFSSNLDSTSLKLIRYIHYQWYVLEAVRSIVYQILCVLLLAAIYDKSIRTINVITNTGNDLTYKAIQLFNQHRIIHQTGEHLFTATASVLMAFAFVMCTLGLWLIATGRKLFPVQFYVPMCLLMIIVFFLTIVIMLAVVNNYESTKHLTGITWGKRELHKFIRKGHLANANYWRMLVRSLRPLTLYYGVGKFGSDTLLSFGNLVINYTVTFILITVR